MTSSGVLQPAETQTAARAGSVAESNIKSVEGDDPTILLYRASHFRRAIVLALFLAFLCDVSAFIVGCLALASLSYSNMREGTAGSTGVFSWTYADGSAADYGIRNFFYYLFIPLLISINASWEIDLIFRRRLSALRIVSTASFSILLWLCALAMWLSCSLFVGRLSTGARDMCPFGFLIWDFSVPFPTKAFNLNAALFWFPPVAIAFYIPYLVLGCILHHRRRKYLRRKAINPDIGSQHVDDDGSAFELESRTSSLIVTHVAAHYASTSQSSSVLISSSSGVSRWSNGISVGETLTEEGSVTASRDSIAPSYREQARFSEMMVARR